MGDHRAWHPEDHTWDPERFPRDYADAGTGQSVVYGGGGKSRGGQLYY